MPATADPVRRDRVWLFALVGAALVVLTYLALRRRMNRPDAT